ncbi:MAG: nucleotidyltransferase family protein [Lachnospiraceae bacterium]
MITAILLASGYSRRMHTDKLLLDFHGLPVIARVMKAISSCPFDQKILIQRTDVYTELAQKYGFQSYQNHSAQEGQSSSVRCGVSHSRSSSALMFFVGDQPCLTAKTIERLLIAHQEYPDDIIVPAIDGQFKNPVIFAPQFQTWLSDTQGDQGGRTIIKKFAEHVRTVTFHDTDAFHDIDTIEDYEFLLSSASSIFPHSF